MSGKRVMWIVLGVLLALGLGLRLVLPGLARDALVQAIGDATGREASLDEVSFGLLAGRAELAGFSLAGEAEPLVALESLSLRLSWLALVSGRVHVDSLEIDGLSVRVSEAEPLVVDRAAEPEPEPEAEPEPEGDAGAVPEEEGAGWPVRVDGIRLSDLRVLLGDEPSTTEILLAGASLASLSIDESGMGLGALDLEQPRVHSTIGGTPESAPATDESAAAEPLRLGAVVDALPGTRIAGLRIRDGALRLETDAGPLELELDLFFDEVVLERGGETRIGLETRVGEGELVLDGQLTLDPLRFEGTLGWSEVALGAFQPFIPELSVEGRTSAELKIDLAVAESEGEEGLEAGLSGELAVLEARGTDPDQRVMGWDSLLVTIRDIRWSQAPSGDPALVVQLEAIRLSGPDVQWSALPAAQAPQAEPAAPVAADEGPTLTPEVVVDLVQIVEGRVFVRDPAVSPPLEARARFAATVESLAWPVNNIGSLSLSAVGKEGEALAVSGRLEQGQGRVQLDLEALDLARFDGYTSNLAGIGIEKGDLSWQCGVDVKVAAADVACEVVLADLDLADREAGALDTLLGVDVVGVPYDVALPMLRDQQGRIKLPLSVTVTEGGTRLDLLSIVRQALQQSILSALSTPLATMNLLTGLVIEDSDVPLPSIAFAPGSAAVNAAAQERLGALAELLAARDDVVVSIAGRVGPADASQLEQQQAAPAGAEAVTPAEALAAARSRAALDVLVTRFGVAPERVELGPAQDGLPGIALLLRPRTPAGG